MSEAWHIQYLTELWSVSDRNVNFSAVKFNVPGSIAPGMLRIVLYLLVLISGISTGPARIARPYIPSYALSQRGI